MHRAAVQVVAVVLLLHEEARDVGHREQVDELPHAVLDEAVPDSPAEEPLAERPGVRVRVRVRARVRGRGRVRVRVWVRVRVRVWVRVRVRVWVRVGVRVSRLRVRVRVRVRVT